MVVSSGKPFLLQLAKLRTEGCARPGVGEKRPPMGRVGRCPVVATVP